MNQAYTSTSGSVEEFEQRLASLLDVECTQSAAGPASISFSARQVCGSLVYSTCSSQRLLLRGERSRHWWTLAPVSDPRDGASAQGRSLRRGELLLLNPGGEAFQQLAPDHRQYAISMPVDTVRDIIEHEHHRPADHYLATWGALRLGSRVDELTRKLAASLFARVDHNRDEFAGDVLAVVLAGGAPQPMRAPMLRRRRIVSQAEELIRSRLHDPPSITELCVATNATRRTLFYAFTSLLGRSPKQHTKLLRLHTARRRFLQSPEALPVRVVAEELGFWYPGLFAAEYRQLFGVLPSETAAAGKR
ncbi:AraC family transcriptional regulator [Pseudohaliea rubra]|uniref:HTH araC/xylS-type domain-containing protein n=1 Tax=Pseudohaliea rubra DSM 19751 TaxID=1265313 RepID=A0A095WX63_9GAMM|nr:AraC family transcriptional regulator [Pseudohaliea rubra]KGE03199.1 hypothetical protein HRUBRA_02239 [Pseudohaliea rubra DSM 19751]